MSTLKVDTIKDSTGSSTVEVSIPALETRFASAWVKFNGTGTPAINDAYNVSSITDNAVGDYSINFTNTLADANYAAVAGGVNTDSTAATTTNNRAVMNTFNFAVGSVDVSCLLSSASALALGDADIVCVAIFGGN